MDGLLPLDISSRVMFVGSDARPALAMPSLTVSLARTFVHAVSHLLPCMPASYFFGDPRKRFLPHLFEWGASEELRNIVVGIELAHSVYHRMRACESYRPVLFLRLLHARARQLLRR
eukprot:4356727-Pyramimonas_sp.AAC.1